METLKRMSVATIQELVVANQTNENRPTSNKQLRIELIMQHKIE
jgi:hypothetical protein